MFTSHVKEKELQVLTGLPHNLLHEAHKPNLIDWQGIVNYILFKKIPLKEESKCLILSHIT